MFLAALLRELFHSSYLPVFSRSCAPPPAPLLTVMVFRLERIVEVKSAPREPHSWLAQLGVRIFMEQNSATPRHRYHTRYLSLRLGKHRGKHLLARAQVGDHLLEDRHDLLPGPHGTQHSVSPPRRHDMALIKRSVSPPRPPPVSVLVISLPKLTLHISPPSSTCVRCNP